MSKIQITKYLSSTIIVFSLLSISVPTYAFNYVLGTGTYSRPTYSKPTKGNTTTEPNFNTTIRRITDSTADGPNIWLAPEYSRSNPINADGTRGIFTPNEYNWYMYNPSTYSYISAVSPTALGMAAYYDGGAIEPRWDYSDSDVFYYILPGSGNLTDCPISSPNCRATFNKFKWSTQTRTILYDAKTDYPTATNISTATEGNQTKYSRYWAFMINDAPQVGQLTWIIFDKDYYGKDNGHVIGRWENAPSANYIAISPLGNYVVAPTYSSYPGCWACVWDVATFPNTHRNIAGAGGHTSWALDANGNEVYVYQNESNDSVSYAEPATGTVHTIIPGSTFCPTGSCPDVHFSGHNYTKPGWALLSTYSTKGLWSDNQIFAVEIKESGRVWRLADSMAYRPDSNYFKQGWATWDWTGNYVYWGNDWKTNGGMMDVYRIELPTNWYTDLTLGTSDTTPPAAPTGVTVN